MILYDLMSTRADSVSVCVLTWCVADVTGVGEVAGHAARHESSEPARRDVGHERRHSARRHRDRPRPARLHGRRQRRRHHVSQRVSEQVPVM